jgi:hypothetical protein
MSKSPHLGASCADTLAMEQRRVKSITSADLAVNVTMPLSLVYAQNIIAVTRVSMGLDTKDLKSTTASANTNCLN